MRRTGEGIATGEGTLIASKGFDVEGIEEVIAEIVQRLEAGDLDGAAELIEALADEGADEALVSMGRAVIAYWRSLAGRSRASRPVDHARNWTEARGTVARLTHRDPVVERAVARLEATRPAAQRLSAIELEECARSGITAEDFAASKARLHRAGRSRTAA